MRTKKPNNLSQAEEALPVQTGIITSTAVKTVGRQNVTWKTAAYYKYKIEKSFFVVVIALYKILLIKTASQLEGSYYSKIENGRAME